MQAVLIPVHGSRPIRLLKDVTVVGRRRWVCDIFFDDRTVSRFHCLLMKARGDMLYVRDMGSANGTIVNGEKVTEQALLHGDEIVFATQAYRLQISTPPQDVEPKPEMADDARTVEVPRKIDKAAAAQPATASPQPDAPEKIRDDGTETLTMTIEDGENLGGWLRQTLIEDWPDGDDDRAGVSSDPSGTKDAALLSSESDVEPISDDAAKSSATVDRPCQ